MVIKGGARARPGQLATHLLRTDTNERVEILDLHSPIGELHDTFRDWQALSSLTRGAKGLYHANIDPAKDYHMTEGQWLRAADVLAKELGLEGQPRAVVLHCKDGREHLHVVWQRTDVDQMKMISDSKNYLAHERASFALELEFGHEHVPGKHAKRDREKQPEFPRANLTHDEWQQKERTGIDPRERKDQITSLYERSETSQAFRAALAEEGYILANGDRRALVLVDQFGEVHSLNRQITSERSDHINAFMEPLRRDTLPDITEARRHQEARAKEQQEQKPEAQPAPEETDEQRRFREALAARQAEDLKTVRATYDSEEKQRALTLDQELKQKMDALDARQKTDREQFYKQMKKQRSGLDGYRDAVDRHLRPQLAADREAARQKDFDDFHARQKIERNDQLTLLRQNRDEEIDALVERNAGLVDNFKRLQAAETERYREEHIAAEELRQKLERDRAQDAEKNRNRDGPDLGPTR